MSYWQVLVLGLVEGLTEFVPVSSTGHLILANRVLGLSGPAVDAFTVVIQLGALLAAFVYYRRVLWQLAVGLWRRDAAAARLLFNLVLGALPLLLFGYAFGGKIKARLFHPVPVAAALLVGGVFMLLMDRWQQRRQDLLGELDALPPARALTAGLVQVLALWPGTSRSMASIVGGQLVGLTTPAAADFAFLLALPTLGVATLYELLKERALLAHTIGPAPIALGLLVSFVVGLLVITGFLRYLRRFGLWAFGCYRLALGLLLLLLLS